MKGHGRGTGRAGSIFAITMAADPGIISGLQTTHYVYERLHALLAEDAYRPEGPNIGRRGQNLTVSFLSLNRSSLSIRLLRSLHQHLPDFEGEILIVDNGSAPEELAALRRAQAELSLRSRIVELGENRGVAGGRNRAIKHVTTDWVLCLDNDIYLIANPLAAIQRDLALLGCHFLNLPLLDRDGRTLFSRGGHLYTHIGDDGLGCGGGSAFRQEPADAGSVGPCLSTFLLGGASVLNQGTFLKLGGYDEGMFIGFEDIDFSIRLLRAGYKVGNCGTLALVHDHPPPAEAGDADYERRRFSRDILFQSARHLEAKHGLSIWNAGVDAWLEQRHADLGVAPHPTRDEPAAAPPSAPWAPAEARGRPRIGLLVDIEGWAFWNISRQLCRYLGDRYDFRIIETTVVDSVVRLFLMTRDCDLVHFFWREYANLMFSPSAAESLRLMNTSVADFIEKVVRPRVVSTCIYDHLSLSSEELAARLPLYRRLADIYYVGSNRLRDIYLKAPDYPPPAAVLEDGVDLTLFGPRDLERFDRAGERELVIGWAGNSNWSGQRVDYKGVRTILRPALEQLRAERLPVRPLFADRACSALIPHRDMVHYYRAIDVYVCTSLIEGTPNPVLEAMACGVPVITTDVGVVPDVFGPRQKEFILAERSVECLKSTLRRLVGQPQLLKALSEENRQQIQAWDWSFKTAKFDQYFQQCLRLRAARQEIQK